MKTSRLRSFSFLGVTVLTVVCSFVLGRQVPTISRLLGGPSSFAVSSLFPDATYQFVSATAGTQLLFVYVGSSSCGSSNNPDVPEMIRALQDLVRSKAQERNYQFVSIGIAAELNPESGIDHLAKVSAFDEIAAGQSQHNQALAHFVHVDHRGLAATPQVIIVERNLVEEAPGRVDPSIRAERVLLRKVGLAELQNWLALGGPLPLDSNHVVAVD